MTAPIWGWRDDGTDLCKHGSGEAPAGGERAMMRVLVASDLRRGAPNVVARAIRLVGAAGSVRVVHVAPSVLPESECLAARRQMLVEAQLLGEALDGGEIDFSARILRGETVAALVHEADKFHADLILLGAHGEPHLRDTLFGTTASKLIRDTDRPILVVRNDHANPYAIAMIALDDSGADEAALRLTCEVAPDAALIAIHAFARQAGEFASDEDLAIQVQAKEQARVERMMRKLGKSNDARCVVRRGEANDALMHGWIEGKPDLLTLATHGRSGFGRLFAGSHADAVLLGCPADILIVRRDKEDARFASEPARSDTV
jgi:nucleotide-binding universal stress UspA family protein